MAREGLVRKNYGTDKKKKVVHKFEISWTNKI
jgi:hypothetical protein